MMTTSQKWPQLPKGTWRRFIQRDVAKAAPWPELLLPAGVMLRATHDTVVVQDALAAEMTTGQVHYELQVTVSPAETVEFSLPVSGVLTVRIAAGVTCHLREIRTGHASQQQRALVQLELAPGASVRYDTFDTANDDVLIYRHAQLANDATIKWHTVSLGTACGAIYHAVDLVGTGSRAVMNTAALSSEQADLTLTTAVTNVGRQTQGLINQHAVLTDHARLVMNGIGAIRLGARGSDAQQENRVLVLSEGATGEANPLLLIDENDVTAGHAASVAAIDETQLRYLMSRGLPRTTALRLVVMGFLMHLMPTDLPREMQDWIQAQIAQQLGKESPFGS